MNMVNSIIQRSQKRKEERKKLLNNKLEKLESELNARRPFAFVYEPFKTIQDKYNILLNKRDFIEQELSRYQTTKKDGLLTDILLILIELFTGIMFLVYLYRIIGPKYFQESIPKFIVNITGNEYALLAMVILEAITVVIFAYLFKKIAETNLTFRRYNLFKKSFLISSIFYSVIAIIYFYISS